MPDYIANPTRPQLMKALRALQELRISPYDILSYAVMIDASDEADELCETNGPTTTVNVLEQMRDDKAEIGDNIISTAVSFALRFEVRDPS